MFEIQRIDFLLKNCDCVFLFKKIKKKLIREKLQNFFVYFSKKIKQKIIKKMNFLFLKNFGFFYVVDKLLGLCDSFNRRHCFDRRNRLY